ncbi:MAG: hypothetical protein ACREBH_03650 [Candidatus Micrarchaeaceae archaeon]
MNAYGELKRIYKPKYVALNIAIAIVYYFAVSYLLKLQQEGVPITSVPLYLVYALIATSSITLTIAIYSAANTRRNEAKVSATSASVLTTIGGGIFAGCGCQAAILFNVIAFSAGTGEAASISIIASENAPYIFAAMIVINLLITAYYLEKFTNPSCNIKKTRKK